MRTIAVLNQKGGVGKTTTVANTAAALAAMGAKVVVIDLDPQAHLTIHLGLEPQTLESGSYKVLTRSADFAKEILLTRLNLWLLPANINLVGAETELVSVVGRETILREALEHVQGQFDYCLIDCPPSLGLLTLNALAAAQEVLIPLQPHFLALQGFGKLLQTVELVNRRINPDLKVTGILLCMFDSRASLPNEVRADIEQFLEGARGTQCAWAEARILPTCIRRNIKLAEAPSYGKTIFEYERNCHGAEDYRKVAEFIYPEGEPVVAPPLEAGSERVSPEQADRSGYEPSGESEGAEVCESAQPDVAGFERVDSGRSRRESDAGMASPAPAEAIPAETDWPAVERGDSQTRADAPDGDDEDRKPPFEIRSISRPHSQTAPSEPAERPFDPAQPDPHERQ
ncbi:MAG: AAA family ATPase [Phycisphaerales bacterium]|nr:MAG: AAA family ATPase [Phycisphaerales bacterium]